jgi:hypothetical protein
MSILNETEIQEAIAYNLARRGEWALTAPEVQTLVGAKPDGKIGPRTVGAIAQWQASHKITADGKVGPDTEQLLLRGHEMADAASGQVRTPQAISLGADAVARARQDFARREYTALQTRRMQRVLGETQDGRWGALSVQALATFQIQAGLAPTGIVDPATLRALEQHEAWAADPIVWAELDTAAQNDVVEYTKTFESARGTPATTYGSTNTDAEWEGAFDTPKKDAQGRFIPPSQRKLHPGFKPHSASQYHPTKGFHVGLSYGAWQAAQEFGTLGEMLLLFRHRNADLFDQIMGGRARSKAVLLMTNAEGKRVGDRSPRVQKLEGADLWDEPWLSRFKELAQHEVFRQAQRDIIISQYLVPVCALCAEHRLLDQVSIAVLFDVSIQHGVGGMTRYLNTAITNMRSAKVRRWDAEDPKQATGSNAPAYRPQDHIELFIQYGLPEAHRERRRNILRMASPWIIHTLASVQGIQNPAPNTLLRTLKDEAKRL